MEPTASFASLLAGCDASLGRYDIVDVLANLEWPSPRFSDIVPHRQKEWPLKVIATDRHQFKNNLHVQILG
jgi:hypothetical protein